MAPLAAARAGVASASGFVASGGAAKWAAPALRRQWLSSPSPSCAGEGRALAAAVHRQGGTVVATGGCFDLLHAGHISTLRAAREMGDCLIVCLNSDASVARLKGPTRPLVGERDRAHVLAALECVDAVMIFDEDTPHAAITELRPEVWVKGGDYGEQELPERSTVEECGGRVATVRYLDGHSTSGLLEEVVCRGGS
jgi:rfaE bifunctional protein nucleotidyltransferase chain/domain